MFISSINTIHAQDLLNGVTLYKNILPQLGVSLGYGKIIDGLNISTSTNYSVGLIYNFNKYFWICKITQFEIFEFNIFFAGPKFC